MAKVAKIAGVCVAIICLDIAAGMCGIEAEKAQDKVKHWKLWKFECNTKHSDTAFKLGLAAAGLLILAHFISIFLGCCWWYCSSKKAPSVCKGIANVCLFLSWLIFLVGLGLLVLGTHQLQKKRCDVTLIDNLLQIGGMVCFLHGGLVAGFCIFATDFCVSATEGGKESKSSTR